MAVTYLISNHFKQQLNLGNIDFDTDVFKVILMNNTFTFDVDADATLPDITADQLATGGGYTQDDETLANVNVVENDTTDKSEVTWDDVSWTATSGGFGPAGAFCIYDDTTTDDTIICCVDFGEDYTIPIDSVLTLQDIKISLA